MSTRKADINNDLPFSIVKKTSELHRARTVAEEKLYQSQSELALLSDAISNQVGHIEFRERCIAENNQGATVARYKAAEMEKKLRGVLQAIGSLRKDEYARRRKGHTM